MKFAHLVIRNLLRGKVRTALSIGSFAVALFLFGVLSIVNRSFGKAADIAGADRLMVQNRVSIIQPLPISYLEHIARSPGVKLVSYATWFGGVYQDPRNFFPQYAIDASTWRSMFSELTVPEKDWRAFLDDREGCIVGASTAERFGFKIGDHIPIKGTIYQGVWEFTVRGIYHSTRRGEDLRELWFHNEYLDERREFAKGLVGWYSVKIDDPSRAREISRAIDQMFVNSPFETKTQTEKEYLSGWVKQIGHIGTLVEIIGTVVFLTLLLVVANTMALAIRERTRETALFKTVGFSDNRMLMLVQAEAATLAVLGGGIGILLVDLLTMGGDPTNGMIQAFYLPTGTAFIGMALALAIGLACGMLPALSVKRLQVAAEMRRL